MTQLSLSGDKALTTFLDNMDRKGRKKVVRYGVGRGGAALRKAVRLTAPTETKALRKSIGSKVKVFPSGVAVAIVGPRTHYKLIGPDGKVRRPVKYAHLVEFGTENIKPTRFFTRAFNSSQGAVTVAMREGMKKKLRQVVLESKR